MKNEEDTAMEKEESPTVEEEESATVEKEESATMEKEKSATMEKEESTPMEKEANTQSSSSSSDDSVTSFKTAIFRCPEGKQTDSSSSSDGSSSSTLVASSEEESNESTDSDTLSGSMSFYPGSSTHESTRRTRTLSSHSSEKSLQLKRPRLDKQDTLADVENLPMDVPSPDESSAASETEAASPTECSEENAPTADPLPSPPRVPRPYDLKLKPCWEETPSTERGEQHPKSAVEPRSNVIDAAQTPMPPASDSEVFKVPPSPASARGPARQIGRESPSATAECGAEDVSMSDSGGSDSGRSGSSVASAIKIFTTSPTPPATAGTLSRIPLVESVETSLSTQSSARLSPHSATTQSQSPQEGAMDVAEEDAAATINTQSADGQVPSSIVETSRSAAASSETEDGRNLETSERSAAELPPPPSPMLTTDDEERMEDE